MLAREILNIIRRLSRTPAFTLAALASLALGIGANTAMFSLLDALLFKPLPVREPNRLVRIASLENNGRKTAVPGPLLNDLRRDPLLAGVCGFQTPLSTIELTTTPEPVSALSVTGDCYKTLGVRPVIGRIFTPADDIPNGPRVAMLSYAFWQERFGGNPNVLGQTIGIGSDRFTIIGVTEQHFRGLLLGFPAAVSFLLSQEYALRPGAPKETPFFWANVLARLKPGASQRELQAQLETKWRRLLDEYLPGDRFKAANREEILSMPLEITSGATGVDYSMRDKLQHPLTALTAVSFLVLLVSCINVANLYFARGLRLRREIAVRFALGASRAHIVRSQVLESALLLLGGMVLAAELAYACDRLLLGMMSRYYSGFSLDPGPDKLVLVSMASAALLCLLLFGLLPALRSSDFNSAAALKAASSRTVSGGRATARRVLICAQVAVTLVLVTGAAAFVETLRHMQTEPLGFQTDSLIDAQLAPLPRALPDKFNVGNYCIDLMDRMRALPGVESVSMSSFSPLSTIPFKEDIHRVASPGRAIVQAPGEFISDGFLNAMHIPLLQGHDFARSDRSQSQKTAIVSESLAERLFPHRNALGRHIQFGTERETRDLEIVGIASDARVEDVHTGDLSFVYFNFWQHPQSGTWGNLQVRYMGSAGQMIAAVRSELEKVGRQYALHLTPLSELRDNAFIREKLVARLGALFAVLALTLAAVGLFGLLSFFVAARTGEFGVRMALGAERAVIGWLVLREALVLVGTGIALGLPLCYFGLHALSKVLYGISPLPIVPLLLSMIVLCAVSVGASLIPARRASLIDPIMALRQE